VESVGSQTLASNAFFAPFPKAVVLNVTGLTFFTAVLSEYATVILGTSVGLFDGAPVGEIDGFTDGIDDGYCDSEGKLLG